MKYRLVILVFLMCLVNSMSNAQIGIGTTSPNASAALDISSNSKGLLFPRLTTIQRATIANPIAGMVIFCTNCGTNGELQLYNGTAWFNPATNTVAATVPIVTTTAISNITKFAASSGATIVDNGSSSITVKGVCWSTSANPTTANSKTTDGSGNGSFSSSITSLNANTTYYVRAYATSSNGTGYGDQLTFTTLLPEVASFATTTSSTITGYSATISSNITSNNGANVTERGICYSTSTAPTTSNSKLTNGTGSGSYNISITGLLASTTYYVRSYAINSAGTGYGDEISITTGARSLPTLTTTTAISAITGSSATSGGNVTSSGNDLLTARGVCWSTSTISDNQDISLLSTKTNDGTSTGTYTSSLTGLTANTIYYVRAYATNSVGTVYGNQLSFTTIATLAGSLSFNGSNQYLSLNPGIIFGAGAFTLEGWFYHTGNFVGKGLIGTTHPNGNARCLNLYFSSATSIVADQYAVINRTYTMGSAITANAWHYIIYNRNADFTTAVYIDGVRCTSTITDNSDYSGASNYVGQIWNSNYWSGYLTNFRVNVGTAVYNSNVSSYTNPTSELTSTSGTTKYLMLGNSVTSDASNTQTITNNGTVGLSALKPF